MTISIVVPIYNAVNHIKRCINSIMNQTYQDIEVILVDDGSNDGSSNLCDKYQEIDSRIKVIHKKNGGVSSARNIGIDAASGDFIGFIDADDYIEKDMYEHLYRIITKDDADIAICNYDNVDDSSHSSLGSYFLEEMIMTSSEAIENIFKANGFKGYLWNKLFRTELLTNSHEYIRLDPEISICEDLLFVCKCITRSKKIVYSPIIKYHYYNNENSALRSGFNEKDLSIIKAYDQMKKIINEYPSAKQSFTSNMVISYMHIMIQILESDDKYKFDCSQIKNVLNKYWKIAFFDPTVKNKYKLYCFMMVHIPNFFIRLKKILCIIKMKVII